VRFIKYLFSALLASLSLWFAFHKLGAHSISVRSDEVVYVRVVQEMVHENAWWRLRHGRVPFYNKPPLKLWLSALTVKAMGESNFSYRFVDALCGVLLILFSAWAAGTMLASWSVGSSAGFLLLSSAVLFTGTNSVRKAVLDGMLVFLTMLGTFSGYWLCEAARKGQGLFRPAALCGMLTGAAVLVKSVAGLIPLMVLALFLTWSKERKVVWQKGRAYIALALLLAVLLPAIYFVPRLITDRHLRQILLVEEIYKRFVYGFSGHHLEEPLFFVKCLLLHQAAMPGWLLILGLTYGLWCSRDDDRFRFLLTWAVGPVVLFSLSRSRLIWYIAPAIPAMAVLSACALDWLWHVALSRFYALRSSKDLLLGLSAFVVLGMAALSLGRAYLKTQRYIDRQENKRLAVDLAVAEIKARPQSKVVMYRRALSTGANPRNGKFNVDGFYRGMIRERIIEAGTPAEVSQAVSNGAAYVFVRSKYLFEMPAGAKSRTVLPPFHGRREEVTLLSY